MFELKPRELKTGKYWLHLVILAAIVLGILQYFYGGEMFTLKNVLISVPLLAAGDIVAHTLLGLE